MNNNLTITPTNLVDEFCKEYESKKGKFLLFDLANANENANTKVLKYLLQYNNCQFLNSFLNKIGLPKPNGSVSITDQKKAIGPKAIFSGDVDGEWVLHFTPSFIILYKKSWAALDTRKYSIPSLYLYAGSTDFFLKNSCLNTLKLGVDHLSPSKNVKYPEFIFGNHGKSIGLKLLDNPGIIKCSDINSQAARKEFYNKIIDKVKTVVDVIDKSVVEEIQKSGSSVTPDEILEKIVHSMQVNKILLKQ